jgi:hypothetical protein
MREIESVARRIDQRLAVQMAKREAALLTLAAHHGHVDMVEYLLEAGTDINAGDYVCQLICLPHNRGPLIGTRLTRSTAPRRS